MSDHQQVSGSQHFLGLLGVIGIVKIWQSHIQLTTQKNQAGGIKQKYDLKSFIF